MLGTPTGATWHFAGGPGLQEQPTKVKQRQQGHNNCCLTATVLSVVSNPGVRKIFLCLIIAKFVATVVVPMLALLDLGWLLL